MPRRSKADAEKTRERFISVAIQLFQKQGYADTSINQICNELGITKGALFHHFKSKEGLFLAAWTRLQEDMDAEARTAAIAARSRSDPYASLLAGCRTYLKYAVRSDYQTIVLVDGPAVLGQQGWYEKDFDLGAQNMNAGMRYLAKKGIVEEGRVQAFSVMLQSALNGAGFALARQEPGVTADGIYDAFEAMVKGLR
jgi:AcrR family transcriptional regulator